MTSLSRTPCALPEPHPAVRAWLDDQAAEALHRSSVTDAELTFGMAAGIVVIDPWKGCA